MRAAIADAAHGVGTLLVVTGEPGMGKSRLLAEAWSIASAAGFAVLDGRAGETEVSRPFAALRDAFGEHGVGVVAAGPGEPERGWLSVPEGRFQIVDRFVDALDGWAAVSPVCLILDDAQWFDQSTSDALTAIVRRMRDRPVLVLVASRPVERGRLESTIGAATAPRVLDLAPLSAEAVELLVADQFDDPPDAAVLRRVARGGGNPLFVLALLDDAGADGEIPADLRRAVMRRIGQLEPGDRDVVIIAAVYGLPLPLEVLADLCTQPLVRAAAAVRATALAGVLADTDALVRFRHDVLREVVYESIPPATRTAYHREIAERLLAGGARPSEVAGHLALGAHPGDVRAATLLRLAAAELGSLAPDRAVDLLARAADVLPADHPDLAICAAELAQSMVFSGQLVAADELVGRELRSARTLDAELGLRMVRTQVYFLRGDAALAALEFERMAQLAPGQPRTPTLLADASVAALFTPDLDRAGRLATAVGAMAGTVEPGARALALAVHSWVVALRGDLAGALTIAREALHAADLGGTLDGHRRLPHLLHGQVAIWNEELDEARWSLQRGASLSERLRMGWDEPMYLSTLSDLLVRLGEWDDAVATCDAGLERATDVGSHFADVFMHTHLARLALLRGDIDASRLAIERAAAAQTAGRHGIDQVLHVQGLLALATGDAHGASSVLGSLWHALGRMGVELRRWEIAPDVLRAALGAGQRDLVGSVVSAVESWEHDPLRRRAAEPSGRWVRGLVAGDVEALAGAQAHLLERCRPADALRCGLDLDAARGVVPRRARPDAIGLGWASLTASEQRVARLVGAGRSNVEIAGELHVSRRTVESHLYHLYPKLGLAGRVDLVLYVNRLGAPATPTHRRTG